MPWQSNNIQSMGQNGLLYFSLGFLPSRDNVWTSAPDVDQPSCNRYCFEPNPAADNAVAVLGGGPYGPSDAVGFTDKSIVMRACRTDGVMLRPAWPLSSLDATFTRAGSALQHVWAAHDDFGLFRWSYVVGINLDSDFAMLPKDLQGPAPAPMLALELGLRIPVATIVPFNDSHPLKIPACPAQAKGPGSTHWVTAPVLPGGFVLLGDVSKWAPMSSRRVATLSVEADSIAAQVVGAKAESVTFSYALPRQTGINNVVCDFSKALHCEAVRHDDTDCHMTLTCNTKQGCTCAASSFSPLVTWI